MSSAQDRLVGLSMLLVATFVFFYYSIWVLLMPFVDQGHILHSLFPARVWAIRIPMLLLLFGGATVGSFLSIVLIKSHQKKLAKRKAAGKKKA